MTQSLESSYIDQTPEVEEFDPEVLREDPLLHSRKIFKEINARIEKVSVYSPYFLESIRFDVEEFRKIAPGEDESENTRTRSPFSIEELVRYDAIIAIGEGLEPSTDPLHKQMIEFLAENVEKLQQLAAFALPLEAVETTEVDTADDDTDQAMIIGGINILELAKKIRVESNNEGPINVTHAFSILQRLGHTIPVVAEREFSGYLRIESVGRRAGVRTYISPEQAALYVGLFEASRNGGVTKKIIKQAQRILEK